MYVYIYTLNTYVYIYTRNTYTLYTYTYFFYVYMSAYIYIHLEVNRCICYVKFPHINVIYWFAGWFVYLLCSYIWLCMCMLVILKAISNFSMFYSLFSPLWFSSAWLVSRTLQENMVFIIIATQKADQRVGQTENLRERCSNYHPGNTFRCSFFRVIPKKTTDFLYQSTSGGNWWCPDHRSVQRGAVGLKAVDFSVVGLWYEQPKRWGYQYTMVISMAHIYIYIYIYIYININRYRW